MDFLPFELDYSDAWCTILLVFLLLKPCTWPCCARRRHARQFSPFSSRTNPWISAAQNCMHDQIVTTARIRRSKIYGAVARQKRRRRQPNAAIFYMYDDDTFPCMSRMPLQHHNFSFTAIAGACKRARALASSRLHIKR